MNQVQTGQPLGELGRAIKTARTRHRGAHDSFHKKAAKTITCNYPARHKQRQPSARHQSSGRKTRPDGTALRRVGAAEHRVFDEGSPINGGNQSELKAVAAVDAEVAVAVQAA
jgi:hypothetical protein